MKFKLLILFTFLSFFTWSKTGAATLVFNGKGPFENSFSFRVNLCETEPCSISESQRLQQSKYIIKKLSDFIYKHFYNLGGQQVYRKISPSDLIGTIEYLSNDYSQNLGSSSWDKKEIIKFMNMIRKSGKSAVIYNQELMINRNKAMGFQKDILVYDAKTQTALFIGRKTQDQ